MKQLYQHNGKSYIIYDKMPIGTFQIDTNLLNMDKVKTVRDFLGADHVLRDNTHFLFCETIQDVEWEDIIDEDE